MEIGSPLRSDRSSRSLPVGARRISTLKNAAVFRLRASWSPAGHMPSGARRTLSTGTCHCCPLSDAVGQLGDSSRQTLGWQATQCLCASVSRADQDSSLCAPTCSGPSLHQVAELGFVAAMCVQSVHKSRTLRTWRPTSAFNLKVWGCHWSSSCSCMISVGSSNGDSSFGFWTAHTA